MTAPVPAPDRDRETRVGRGEQLTLPEPAPSHVPGHRYQRVGICQCRIRENDSISGMFSSVERIGVVARLRMTPAEHAEHLRAGLRGPR